MVDCKTAKRPISDHVNITLDEADPIARKRAEEFHYRSVIGMIGFLCVGDKSLVFAHAQLSRIAAKVHEAHTKQIKQVCRYVKLHMDNGSCFA